MKTAFDSSSVNGRIWRTMFTRNTFFRLTLHNTLIPAASQEVLQPPMASSFSSFPSFPTFPDVEPCQSSRKSDSESSQKRRKYDQVSRTRRKERNKSREVDTERRKKPEPLVDRGGKRDGNRDRHKHKDKERVKEKDSERDDGHKSKRNHRDNDRYKHLSFDLTFDQQKADTGLKIHDEFHKIFFTDTKGDNLYLQYGSLYARDVPKYRLHHGVLHLSEFCNV